MLHVLLVVLALAGPSVLPNASLTPGAVRPLSKAIVCATVWGTDPRHITVTMKQQVSVAYGLPWSDHGQREFDHLVPRSLSGADSTANLWPMCCREGNRIVGPAHDKDVLELRLGRLVCSGQLPLKQAQAEIATDWIAAYHKYVQPAKH